MESSEWVAVELQCTLYVDLFFQILLRIDPLWMRVGV